MKIRRLVFVAVLSGVVCSPAFPAETASAPAGVWAKIYSSDIPTYAANLRAAGVPEATVGVLVSQEINAHFKEREQALEPALTSLQTLKEGWSAERREKLLEIRREKNELLRATLGLVPNETAKLEIIPPSLASATPVQRELVGLIVEDYQAMRARVGRESASYLLEQDTENLRYLDDEFFTDLAKVLGPDNALDFQIERDGFMKAVQQRLELFKPTRLELRDLYTARRNAGIDIEIKNPNASRLTELQKIVLADLAKRWGPERYAEYARSTSLIYQQAYHLVRRLGLPLEVADQLFDSRKAAVETSWERMQQARNTAARGIRPTMNADGTLNRPPTSVEVTKAAATEHCELAKRLLGEAGYQEYYRLNRGWIDNMLEKGAVSNPEMFDRSLPL